MQRAARFWRSREGALVLPALAFYLLVYVYPLGKMAGWSFFDNGFTLKFWRELAGEPVYFKALSNTLEISVLVTVISLLLGYPLAYLMTTTTPRARRVLTVLLLIPFWTSVLVRTFAWLVILGRNGLVNNAILALGLAEEPQKLLFNMIGVQVGMVQVLLPFMVFPLYAVMSRIDLNIIRVARSLGAPPHRVFLHVFLPLSLPGVAAGCIIVFLLAVGFYVTPALLGGPGQITLATMIDMMITTFLNFGFAATLGLLLLVVVAGIFAVVSALMGLNRIVGGRGRFVSGARIALWALASILMAFLVAPIVIIMITSFNGTPYMEFPPKSLSLRWYTNFFTSPQWYQTAITSLKVAIPTMIAATVLGTSAAIGIVRGSFPGRRALEAFFVSPMVVPIVVIALGFYFLFSGYKLLDTPIALFLGHTVIATPLVIVMVRAALQTTNPAMEFAARSLGAGFWRALWYVTLPSVRAAIGSAAAFAFLVSFDDVVIAIFVAGPNSTTLPKRMWESIRFEIDPTLTAIASLLTIVAVVVLVTGELLRRADPAERSE